MGVWEHVCEAVLPSSIVTEREDEGRTRAPQATASPPPSLSLTPFSRHTLPNPHPPPVPHNTLPSCLPWCLVHRYI